MSCDEFYGYFSNLENNIFSVIDHETETLISREDFVSTDAVHEDLDNPISIEEVSNAIKSLKSNKAPGNDDLLNEYFICASDILSPFLCELLNTVFNVGVFPDKLLEGIIIPLHKKGSTKDVNNYRGITLISCLAKLFTSILNKRLSLWCESNNVISDAQFGFKKGHSTIDAIFVLQSIIQEYLHKGKKSYCTFVDMRKAFDSIYRNGLWFKLYKCGIRGKMLNIMKSVYCNIKSCVKHLGNKSIFFDSLIGLKHGEVLSPLLFSLFVEDLEMFILNKDSCG